MITFLNNYFCYYNIAFLHKKSEAVKAIESIFQMWQNITSHSIKRLHTNNGEEYIMLVLQFFLREQEIIYETSTPYIYQKNSYTEQLNCILLEKV